MFADYSALHNALQHEIFKIIFGCVCTGPEMPILDRSFRRKF
jgi:hypothetical protein